jgi:hypothetical protein
LTGAKSGIPLLAQRTGGIFVLKLIRKILNDKKVNGKMRPLLISLFIVVTLTTFGQKNIEKAWILRDGQEISFAEFKQNDPTNFSVINVIPGNKKTVKLFGRKSKRGIVHLKTHGFIENQNILFDKLKTEFKTGSQETKILVINGIPYDRNETLDKIIADLKIEDIEWIVIPENSLNTQPVFNNNDKRVKVIQTNTEIEIPIR